MLLIKTVATDGWYSFNRPVSLPSQLFQMKLWCRRYKILKNWAHDPVLSAKEFIESSQKACFRVVTKPTGESIVISIVQHAVTEKEGNRINTNCIFLQFLISVHMHFKIYIRSYKIQYALVWLTLFVANFWIQTS